jgi:hypothetical protein
MSLQPPLPHPFQGGLVSFVDRKISFFALFFLRTITFLHSFFFMLLLFCALFLHSFTFCFIFFRFRFSCALFSSSYLFFMLLLFALLLFCALFLCTFAFFMLSLFLLSFFFAFSLFSRSFFFMLSRSFMLIAREPKPQEKGQAPTSRRYCAWSQQNQFRNLQKNCQPMLWLRHKIHTRPSAARKLFSSRSLFLWTTKACLALCILSSLYGWEEGCQRIMRAVRLFDSVSQKSLEDGSIHLKRQVILEWKLPLVIRGY